MPLLIGLVALGLGGLAVVARPVVVLRLLIGTTLLLPATLDMPGSPTPALTVTRLVLLGAALGLLVRVRLGWLPGRVFALTAVHLAWAVYVAVVLVAGVWFASFDVSSQSVMLRLFSVLDPLLFLVVSLALLRRTGLRPAVVALTVTVAAAALIMVVEHVTQLSWGRLLFTDLPGSATSDAARLLERRGGGVRVRGASEFALQAGWMLAALLPLLLVAASLGGWLRRVALPVVVVVMLAEAWTVSRSALVGIAAGSVLVLILSRARVAQQFALSLIGFVVVALVVVPGLIANYSLSIDQGSVDVRGARLPFILNLAADQPWFGLGLGGLGAAGFPTTDATYLLTYVELGVVGLSALLVLFGVTVLACTRVLRLPAGPTRAIGVGALAGVLVLLAGGLAFDSLQVLQTARLLQLLVALAIVAAEREFGPSDLPARPHATALLPAVLGVCLGALAAGLAPGHSAQTSRLLTIPAFREVGPYDPVTAGRTVLNNACAFIDERAGSLPARVRCTDLQSAAGVGQLRVEAANAATVDHVTDLLGKELRDRGQVYASIVPETGIEDGTPTPLRTAPVWLGLLALGRLLLPARRRPRAAPDQPAVVSSSA